MILTNVINIRLLLIIVTLGIAFAVSTSCGKREAPAPAETKPVEPIQATPVPQPSSGKTTETAEGQTDYSIEELIRNWPKDVPLMEPYRVNGYLPEYNGFRQISIISNAGMDEVYNFYADNLFVKGGWEPVEGSKAGVPNIFMSFKCRKDVRELDVMLKSEQEGRETLVQLGLTDLTKHKKKTE